MTLINNQKSCHDHESPVVTIRMYEEKDAAAFDRLNRHWLETYFVVEPFDHEVLTNPDTYIIQKGGTMVVAELDGEVVGIVALMPLGETNGKPILELTKMAVDETLRGFGIGRRLMDATVEQAARMGAGEIIIYSSTKLPPAIHLYKSSGFEEIPTSPEDQERYQRCNIKLRRELTNFT